MKHIVIKLILAVITTIFALQPCDGVYPERSRGTQGESLAWGQTKGAAALTAVWAARSLSPGQNCNEGSLRPLANEERRRNPGELLLIKLKAEFASALKSQIENLELSILANHKPPAEVSRQDFLESVAARQAWAQVELHRLIGYLNKTCISLRDMLFPEDRREILSLIETLRLPMVNRNLMEIRQVYQRDIFPALDRLILQCSLRAAVDARDRGKTQHLVDQINALGGDTMAMLVECPMVVGQDPEGNPVYDERFGIGSKMITALNSRVDEILRQLNLANERHVIHASTWMIQEFPINMLKHARDNLPADNRGMSAFGVVIVRIVREQDGIKIEFTSQDNGGGSNIDNLFEAAKEASENPEKPTGRGIQVICGLIFDDPDFIDGSFIMVSRRNGDEQNKLVFTGCVEGYKTKDSSIENGLYARISYKVAVLTPLEQIREVEVAAGSAASSVLRPQPANERRPIRPMTSFESEVPIDESAYPLINNIMPPECAVSIQGIISHFDMNTFRKAGCLKAIIYRVGRELRPNRQNMGSIAITIANPGAPEDESVSFIITKTMRSASIDMGKDPTAITGELIYHMSLVRHLRGASGIESEVKLDRETPNPRRFAEIITEAFERETHLEYWERWRGQAWKAIAAKPAKIASLPNSRSLLHSI